MQVKPTRNRVHTRASRSRIDDGMAIVGVLLRAVIRSTGYSFVGAVGEGLTEFAAKKMEKKKAQDKIAYKDTYWSNKPLDYDPNYAPPGYDNPTHYPATGNTNYERFPGL